MASRSRDLSSGVDSGSGTVRPSKVSNRIWSRGTLWVLVSTSGTPVETSVAGSSRGRVESDEDAPTPQAPSTISQTAAAVGSRDTRHSTSRKDVAFHTVGHLWNGNGVSRCEGRLEAKFGFKL